MNRYFFLITTFFISLISQSQEQTLKEVITLKMPLTREDSMPGTRGAGVAWHPVQKKYYAAFAGNWGYPLAIFDIKGNRLSPDNSTTREDLRGIWYNPETKEIQGNTYSDYGWFKYAMDSKGLITSSETLISGMNQPDAQSVGAYNFKDKKVLFIHDGFLYSYDITDGLEISSQEVNWGKKKPTTSGGDLAEYGGSFENYNKWSLIYTGIAGAEIGFLNFENKQIELYDYATCHLSKVLTLPDGASVEPTFNFAYANGVYWLFDMEGRKWHGYK
jgi:hypothetical protein